MVADLPVGRPEFGRPMIKAFLAHPDFNGILRRSSAQKALLFGQERPQHRYAIDRNSSLLGIFALTLFYTPEGLTVGRLQAMRAESNFCSAGRASSFIAVMRKRGDFIPADQSTRKRVRKLALGERFLAFQRERVRIDVQALAELSPIGVIASREYERPTFFPEYLAIAATGLGAAANERVEEVDFFSERNTGLLMLHDIVATSEDALRSVPVPISISLLSKRYEASRTHILRLLRDADSKGLMIWKPELREVTLTPKLVRGYRIYAANILAGTAYCSWMVTEGRRQQNIGAGTAAG